MSQESWNYIVGNAARACHGSNSEQGEQFVQHIKGRLNDYSWGGGYRSCWCRVSNPKSFSHALRDGNHFYQVWVIVK